MSVITDRKPVPQSGGKHPREAGFTLVELLVVIAIFAALSAIAFVALGPTVRSYQLKGAARQIYSDALKVRTQAIKEGKVTGLRFSDDNTGNYEVWVEKSPGIEEKAYTGVSSYGQITACAPTTGNKPTDFVFYPNGTSGGGSVRISMSSNVWKVYVPNTGTGSVKIEKPTPPTPCP
ncbi:MAG: GspH/FimT family pseudopilin [Desulfuromonadaceae bacterium]|nr:GspH/FimT family pseudopilin [Desulfuromonadaceae bacterium]